jgi:hypothetical protein
MKTKKFDCIKMKRLGAAKVREQTAPLTREQELRFWKERSQHLRQRQKVFYIGDDDDFDREVEATRKNERLMEFLDERGKSESGKGISLEEVRRQLGL